jgi:uncharacterized membrane protein
MNEAMPGTTRIEAFSDGVIAIIITIMVLDLRLPENALSNGFAGFIGPLLPKLVIYLLSYAVIAVIWVRHHGLLHVAQRATHALLWSNIHLLLWMSIIPVTTALLGAEPHSPIAAATYGFVLAGNAGAFVVLRWTIYRDTKDADVRQLHVRMLRNNSFALMLYALSVPLAFISVYLSFAIFVLMPGLFFLPDLMVRAAVSRHQRVQ